MSVSFLITKKSIIYNLDKFINGEKNILYVVGLSGSGKTTRTWNYAKDYRATLLELDNLGGFFGKYKSNTDIMHKITLDFLDDNKDLKKNNSKWEIHEFEVELS